MSKPPKTTPHSDMDGVHEDGRRDIDTAVETGQDGEDLKRAGEESVGRPPYDKKQESLDDRTE